MFSKNDLIPDALLYWTVKLKRITGESSPNPGAPYLNHFFLEVPYRTRELKFNFYIKKVGTKSISMNAALMRR